MDEEDFDMNREDLIEMIGEFMTGAMRLDDLYRSHLCDTLVHRVYDEFGADGMAELMLKIDSRADWITDMLFESSDFHDEMFKRYNTYDEDITFKARGTMAMEEMNKKISSLRKRYVKKIVDEIWAADNPDSRK